MSRKLQLGLKRLLDFATSGVVLVLLFPVLGLIAVAVRLFVGSPVFFAQERLGHRGKSFHIYKFRTMADTRDSSGQLLPDAQRLARLGRILRRTSLDELPELFNVLGGEMSLVGPRPLLARYQNRYTPEQARRHEAKPGITGLAQISGRNALGWEERFALDVWYVDHWNLWLDTKILVLTAWKVLRGEGISQPGQATAEEFMGTARGVERTEGI